MNIAIIGLGEHALRNTLPAICQSPSLSLRGVFTLNQKKCSEKAQELSCIAYESIEQLLSDNAVDAVYIASPVGCHADQVKLCLQARKHVLVEKVAFPLLQQATELSELARRQKVTLMEGYMYRFHAQFSHLKALIESGTLGKIHRVDASFGFPHLKEDNVRYKPELSGGALMDCAGYPLSVAKFLFGGKASLIGSVIGRQGEYKVDTRGTALVLQNDIVVKAEWAMGANYRNCVEIWSELAYVTVPRVFSKPSSLETEVIVNRNGQDEVIKIGGDNHFINMFESFVSAALSRDDRLITDLVDMANLLHHVELNAVKQDY